MHGGVVVVGAYVVVTGPQTRLHVLSAATGREERTIGPFTDKVGTICASPDGAHVDVVTADQRGARVDPATGRSTEIPVPKRHAIVLTGKSRDQLLAELPPCSTIDSTQTDDRIPNVDGFKRERLYVDGNDGVVLGVKSPGTALPMAVGFDPKKRTLRFTIPLASADTATVRTGIEKGALAGGRFVTGYGVGEKGFRLVALDAQSGARLWDMELHSSWSHIEELLIDPTRVYIVRDSTLETRDLASGKPVGLVGDRR